MNPSEELKKSLLEAGIKPVENGYALKNGVEGALFDRVYARKEAAAARFAKPRTVEKPVEDVEVPVRVERTEKKPDELPKPKAESEENETLPEEVDMDKTGDLVGLETFGKLGKDEGTPEIVRIKKGMKGFDVPHEQFATDLPKTETLKAPKLGDNAAIAKKAVEESQLKSDKDEAESIDQPQATQDPVVEGEQPPSKGAATITRIQEGINGNTPGSITIDPPQPAQQKAAAIEQLKPVEAIKPTEEAQPEITESKVPKKKSFLGRIGSIFSRKGEQSVSEPVATQDKTKQKPVEASLSIAKEPDSGIYEPDMTGKESDPHKNAIEKRQQGGQEHITSEMLQDLMPPVKEDLDQAA